MAVIGLSTFKIHSHILDMRNMMGLTREEKEDFALDLYYNQGKTYGEIAKEARISLRDIGRILKKSGSVQSLSDSSQAYLLFSRK